MDGRRGMGVMLFHYSRHIRDISVRDVVQTYIIYYNFDADVMMTMLPTVPSYSCSNPVGKVPAAVRCFRTLLPAFLF
jgi:hypothetical protein